MCCAAIFLAVLLEKLGRLSMILPLFAALKPFICNFSRYFFLVILSMGPVSAQNLVKIDVKHSAKPDFSLEKDMSHESLGLTKISLFESFDDDFKHELTSLRIDVLLENMARVAKSSSVTERESECFARSGGVLVRHYDDLSLRQKNALLQCLMI